MHPTPARSGLALTLCALTGGALALREAPSVEPGAPVRAQSTLAPPRHVGETKTGDVPGIQAEVSIAIDPSSPQRLVAATMSIDDGRILVVASRDRGRTWSSTPLPLAGGASFHADPMAAFDSQGRAYVAHIPVRNGNEPLGIEVSRSLDGGLSWAPAVRVSSNLDRDDKVALAADVGIDSQYRDRVYVAWKWPPGGIFVARSVDGGATFSAPARVSDAAVSGLDLAIARDGTVYLAANEGSRGRLRVLRSANGGDSWVSLVGPTVRGDWYTAVPSHCARMSLVHASVAADPMIDNRVYVTWADYPSAPGGDCSDTCFSDESCTSDVFFSRSEDAGATWSTPITVHEEELGLADQYHQWMRADPTDGTLYVAYLDSRHDPFRVATDTYLSRSTDGGLSWEPSVRVSGASGAIRSGFQHGDYQGLTVHKRRAFPAWGDFRPGRMLFESEIYVGQVRYRKSASRWSVASGGGGTTLTVAGRVKGTTAVDLYVFGVRSGDGSRVYLRADGSRSTPTPWTTVDVTRRFLLDVEVPVATIAGLEADVTLLAAELWRSGATPTEVPVAGGDLLSPRLKLPIADLRSWSSG